MIQHSLENYLNEYETLTPTDTQVGADVVATDWWSPLKSQFDNLIWLYYPERMVFINKRFDPEDPDTTYSNIIRSFTIWITSHKRQIDRIYNGFMSDFNPLWNVDGVEGFVSKDTHTGSSTDTHTGDDRMTYEDNGSTTRSGNEVNASSGSDVNTNQKSTFDDNANFKNNTKDTYQHGKSDTHTYNSVRDTKDYDGFKNQNYDSVMEHENDLVDEHVDLKIRQGNIGLTMSTQLLEANDRYYQEVDVFKWIVRSCVNQVTYAVEGVL